MEVIILCIVYAVQMVHGLNVAISGQTYIEPGVPYSVSCTVDEYRDNRQTTFSTTQSPETVIVWYYKQYGCFHWSNGNATDCMNASCSCDDNGLTTHWKYKTPLNLSPPVIFRCFTTDNNSLITKSDPFEAKIALQTGLNVSISGQTYIEQGVPYKVSCTVNKYRDNRQTTFLTTLLVRNIVVWYYKPYGCFHWIDNNALDCRNESCACDDNGLTTHWTYETPLNLSPPVIFRCFTTDNDSKLINSEPFEANIPHGPGSSLIFDTSNNVETKETGQEFSVTCFADCKPPCQFQWTKLNSVVSSGALLHIPELSKDDNGTYVCNAANGYGIDGKKAMYLTVNYGPESVTLLPPDTQYTVTEGNTISPINCTADCRPVCNYTWFGPEVPTGTSNILHLKNIQKKQRGVYNCTAYNDMDSFKSADVNINVQFGPGLSLQFQPSNTSLTKNKGDMLGPHICSATCNPPCQYIWTTPAKATINASQLSVPSLSNMDHGQFICTASNGIGGSQNKTLDVTVNYGPEIVTLLPPDTQYTVTEGNTIPPINCTAVCRPACNYDWSGPTVPAGTSSILILHNIKKSQRGVFNCTAANVVGSLKSSNVHLSVGENMLTHKEDNSDMFSAGIASLVVGLLFVVAATIFFFRKRCTESYAKSSKSEEYSDLQTSNPAFQDPYTSLQNPIESRHHQEPDANTYEECGNASHAASYQERENVNSGCKKATTNMGIYDNMTI